MPSQLKEKIIEILKKWWEVKTPEDEKMISYIADQIFEMITLEIGAKLLSQIKSRQEKLKKRL